jgi:site-specific DNA-methyltransferase (adenine-specific)/modification methylase
MDQYYEFHIEVLRELIRISNLVFYNVQFLTGNKRALFRIMGDLNEQLKEVIIWNKVIAQPAMQPQVLNSQYENILVFEKDNAISRQFTKAPFDRGTVSNVWDIRREPSYDKKHKATFPKELVETILKHFANEGATILDPFMGLGTTGVVALENNMKFVGYELDDYYYNVAKKRLDELKK